MVPRVLFLVAPLRAAPLLAAPLLAALVLAALAAATASAQTVVLAGRMGDRALLVIDGQAQTLGPGQQTASGVRLLRWVGSGSEADAEVQSQGRSALLRIGGTPAQMGAAPARTTGREVVMTAGPGGHFTSAGSINGRQARFIVDTGATLVSLSRADADRMGIDLTGARNAVTQTANGPVPVLLVTLGSVRVGDVELTNVGAAIVPQPMPLVLLGNSFLARLQMRRDNDVMRLELR